MAIENAGIYLIVMVMYTLRQVLAGTLSTEDYYLKSHMGPADV